MQGKNVAILRITDKTTNTQTEAKIQNRISINAKTKLMIQMTQLIYRTKTILKNLLRLLGSIIHNNVCAKTNITDFQ
jgi:hypothetical protein